MRTNIFVIGLDDVNHATLRTLPGASSYRFHQLLTFDELQKRAAIPLPDLVKQARRQVEAWPGNVDAIVGYWDFPVSLMVPLLADRFRTRSAGLEPVLKCEHKYWSRLEQRKVIREYPAFGVVDPADTSASLPAGLSYPVWVKPVKSTGSEGAHYVEDDAAFARALDAERDHVVRMGEPFSWAMSLVDLPPEIAEVGGQACIVEEAVGGVQVTVEGYVLDGDVEVYGVIDSVRHPELPSFVRYQYPSSLPDRVLARLADISTRVVKGVGVNDSTFNVEFFWDAETDELVLLEVNARHSQSHARLFQLVDGVPNHATMVDVALGRRPAPTRRDGPYDVAAKWFMRRFADGVVRRVPTPKEIAALEHEVPGVTVVVTVGVGDRLSEQHGEDSFSCTIAQVFIGARDEDELVHKYARCVETLRFDFEE